jgi:tellurite methyltransferase
VDRTIANYHLDDDGDWVGELSCGHNQHLRHRPPFQPREWVVQPAGREDRLGSAIDCPLCDRAEMPEGLMHLGQGPVWDETNIPNGLRRSHRVAAGHWGLINVLEGRLRFTAQSTPPIEVVLGSGMTQALPPEIPHEVEALGHVRFEIMWFAKPAER